MRTQPFCVIGHDVQRKIVVPDQRRTVIAEPDRLGAAVQQRRWTVLADHLSGQRIVLFQSRLEMPGFGSDRLANESRQNAIGLFWEEDANSFIEPIRSLRQPQRCCSSGRSIPTSIGNLPQHCHGAAPGLRRLFPNVAFIPSGRILIFFQHRLRSPTRTPNLTPIAQ